MNQQQKRISAILIAVLLIVIGFIRLSPQDDYGSKDSGPAIEFQIADGELGSTIASNLEAAGVIKSAKKFVEEFTKDSAAKGISPGSHSIQTRIPVKTAIIQLLDPKRLNNVVVVKEGSTFSDVVAILKKNDHISRANFDLSGVTALYPKISKSLEGSLFPAHYSFESNTSLADAISTMVDKAKSEYAALGIAAGFGKYSSYDLLKIASMVQVEGDPKSFAKVARVIYNRLEIGMPLQLNSTVQYAANLRGKITLSNKATQINSPYNTYRRVGLPPTPISNPSRDALKATMKPASGDWLYFITVAPGDTRFTKDFKEFSLWNTEFNNNVANGKFK